MSYSFDNYGWLSQQDIPGRMTNVVPPPHPAKSIGQPFPNWTGTAWVLAEYSEPVLVTEQNRRILSKIDYMNRFTDIELADIYTAAKSSVQVEIWLEKFKVATEINLDDPTTIAGLDALEKGGLIGLGRALEIRA